jgi:hypothetical protein
MDIKLFTDLFDAIEKAFNAIKKIANLPKETRDELRNTFDETFKLMDTTINMVIIRLSEILRITDDPTFINEVGQLCFDASWTQAEREFRLCKSLRHTVNETQRLRNSILNHISIKEWDEMQNQMQAILYGEDRLGRYISDKFQLLSNMSIANNKTLSETKDELKQLQASLNSERRRLIELEMDMYKNF